MLNTVGVNFWQAKKNARGEKFPEINQLVNVSHAKIIESEHQF
jgi:hypothetical protein